jgi:hypothetical protein
MERTDGDDFKSIIEAGHMPLNGKFVEAMDYYPNT